MKSKWLIIIASAALGFLTPIKWVLAPIIASLIFYRACKNLALPRLQVSSAYVYGGLITGAALKLALLFVRDHAYIAMLMVPFLIWLFSRALFYYFEEKYSLVPVNREKVALKPNATPATAEETGLPDWAREDAVPETHSDATGASAWAGNASGGSVTPDETGARILWDYFGGGEIAMGGPTYGDVVFTNKCAFSGVGPSVVISDNGRYAAMTQPSRDAWGLLIADLKNKRAYQVHGSSLWEIDRIEGDTIIGRFSPITANTKQKISISQTIKEATALPMVQDDGWWVIDEESRKPFPKYVAVTLHSSHKAHRVTFVPDLKPFKKNPFDRYSNPNYSVLVDDVMLEMTVRNASATWVNGAKAGEEGRYLIIADNVIDLIDAMTNKFDIAKATKISLQNNYYNHSNVHINHYQDGGNGLLIAEGYMHTRSTSFNEAEYESNSQTSPWDEEEVTFWGLDGRKYAQKRTMGQRWVRYTIELEKFIFNQALTLSSNIELINRGNAANSMLLSHQHFDKNAPYAAYTCQLSCGVNVGLVTEEAIWSNCGRYLAVVAHAEKPDVPKKIKIVDFETARVRELTGIYALPSFIWFDKKNLQLTHIAALKEEASAHNPWRQEMNRINVDDAKHKDNLYDLLITSLDERRAAMDKKAKKMQTKDSYASGSVNLISQHIMLFAPDFDVPVLQPPHKIEN